MISNVRAADKRSLDGGGLRRRYYLTRLELNLGVSQQPAPQVVTDTHMADKYVTPATHNGKDVPPRFVVCPVCREDRFNAVTGSNLPAIECDVCGCVLSFCRPLRQVTPNTPSINADQWIAYAAVSLLVPVGTAAIKELVAGHGRASVVNLLVTCVLAPFALASYPLIRAAGRPRMGAILVVTGSALLGILMTLKLPTNVTVLSLTTLAAVCVGLVVGYDGGPYGEPRFADFKEKLDTWALTAVILGLAAGAFLPESLRSAAEYFEKLMLASAGVLLVASRGAARLGRYARRRGIRLT